MAGTLAAGRAPGGKAMINAVHALMYVEDADKVRAFFRDVLGFASVDAGQGWLIFALPPAELGIHPVEQEGESSEAQAENGRHVLYLMCDDVAATVEELKGKGVEIAQPISDQGWGLVTSLQVPGGGKLGLYQPRHPTAWRPQS
jgi:predicted enzyme related to lactoylglutathione lyase